MVINKNVADLPATTTTTNTKVITTSSTRPPNEKIKLKQQKNKQKIAPTAHANFRAHKT